MGYLVIANFLSAFFATYLGHELQRFDPILIMWLTAFGTMSWFMVASRKRVPRIWNMFKRHPWTLFIYNVSTLFAWLPWYFAIQALEPAVVQTVSLALSPITTVLLTPWVRPGKKMKRSEIVCAVIAVVGVLFLGYGSAGGKSAVGTVAVETVIFGFVCAFLVALGVVGNTFMGKRLADLGFSPRELLSSRFFVLVGLSLPLITGEALQNAQKLDFIWCAFLSVSLGSIVPLYLLQKGLEKVEPVVFALMLVLVPAVVYLLQLFDPRLQPSLTTLIGISICLGATGFTVLKQYRERRIGQTPRP